MKEREKMKVKKPKHVIEGLGYGAVSIGYTFFYSKYKNKNYS
jgi:hypothetical protein